MNHKIRPAARLSLTSILVLGALCACFGVIRGTRNAEMAEQVSVSAPVTKQQNIISSQTALAKIAPADRAQYKVGVIISEYTATGPSWIGRPYGYGHAWIAPKLAEAGYEVYALIDPGSAEKETLKKVLLEKKLDQKWIDGADLEAMRKLDIILSEFNPNLNDTMVQNIVTVVKEGVTFFNFNSLGTINPGYDEKLKTLLGLENASYLWINQPVHCTVLKEHPMLPGYKAGDKLTLPGMNGWAGDSDGEVVLRADEGTTNTFGAQAPGLTIPSPQTKASQMNAILYRRCGQGLVLHAIWNSKISKTIPEWEQEDLFLNAMDWLAAQRPK